MSYFVTNIDNMSNKCRLLDYNVYTSLLCKSQRSNGEQSCQCAKNFITELIILGTEKTCFMTCKLHQHYM